MAMIIVKVPHFSYWWSPPPAVHMFITRIESMIMTAKRLLPLIHVSGFIVDVVFAGFSFLEVWLWVPAVSPAGGWRCVIATHMDILVVCNYILWKCCEGIGSESNGVLDRHNKTFNSFNVIKVCIVMEHRVINLSISKCSHVVIVHKGDVC